MRRFATAARAVFALVTLGACAAMAPEAAAAQAPPDSTALAVVRITGPSVVAFWRVPASDAELEADPELASLLDEHLYWWAATRDSLAAAGIAAHDRPGQRFAVEESDRRWVFTADPDSAETGHLLVVPGHAPRVLYGRHFPDEVAAAVRAYVSEAARGR